MLCKMEVPADLEVPFLLAFLALKSHSSAPYVRVEHASHHLQKSTVHHRHLKILCK